MKSEQGDEGQAENWVDYPAYFASDPPTLSLSLSFFHSFISLYISFILFLSHTYTCALTLFQESEKR